jgi:hypothetical protein
MYTKAKVYGAADNIKPYVDRAMSDEKFRDDVLSAVKTAAGLYRELMREREPARMAARVATDDDIREKLRDAVDDLRSATSRLQGKRDHSARNTFLLLVGIVLGLLYNPITGPETRGFIRDMMSGGGSDVGGDVSSNGRT